MLLAPLEPQVADDRMFSPPAEIFIPSICEDCRRRRPGISDDAPRNACSSFICRRKVNISVIWPSRSGGQQRCAMAERTSRSC